MDTNTTKCSEVDIVFKQALKEFNENLVAQYSVANKQDSGVLNIKYRDLIANFERVIETTAVSNNGFPLTMGVNAFRGFMNEFMSTRDQVKLRTKHKKDKKKKDSNFTVYNGKYLRYKSVFLFFVEQPLGSPIIQGFNIIIFSASVPPSDICLSVPQVL